MAKTTRKLSNTDGKPVTKGVSTPTKGGFIALFEQHQAAAVDSLFRLLMEPLASFLTWAVIGIALALPLSLLLLLQNLQQLGSSSGFDEVGTISLFMTVDATATRLEELATELAQHSAIAAVELISADAALAEFQASSGFGDVLEGLDENPLPPVFLVTPASTDAEGAAALQAELGQLPEVEHAQLDLLWLQRLGAMVGLASRLAMLLAGMLGLGVILSIGNTIRLAIENRRAEIVVVKLVGGTDAYVARPFLYTGLWYGIGGGLLAVLLITLALAGLQGPITRLMGAYDSGFTLIGLGLSQSFVVLASAGLLGWMGAWVSVLRHLRSIEPK